MIVQRTQQVWLAAALLFRRCLPLGDNNILYITVERCARTLKIGAVFTLKNGKTEISSQRYFLSPSCSYIDSINQILQTDYGIYRHVQCGFRQAEL